MARLILVFLIGDLSAYSPDWESFRIKDGLLWTDTDLSYSVGDIRSISYLRALIDELSPRKRDNNIVTLPIDDIFSQANY